MIANLNDLHFELWLRQRNKGEIKWKTKNGDTIPIKDLSDSHLENIINMLETKEEEERNIYDAMAGFPNEYLY